MKTSIIGLGYVGLPLGIALARHFEVIGFDINETRIQELKNGQDTTQEVEDDELQASSLTFTSDLQAIADSTIYIITVPTPIDEFLKPDLTPVIKATQMVMGLLKKGDTVVYESTVYPGATQEVCVPILEQSGLRFDQDFSCGYSPERVNPGDKHHRVETIKKVVSASNPKALETLGHLYGKAIQAGVHLAPTIKVAEMAKVIENTQRDINIAFINELAMICSKLDIDTTSVLEAAGTKWNFLKFQPGMVGGHCIGVDPYYLAHKSAQVGHIPEMILAGRKTNEQMPLFVASEVIKLMIKHDINIPQAKVLILGATFKENCPDIRNSKSFELYKQIKAFGIKQVELYDPLADPKDIWHEYAITPVEVLGQNYDAVILAVAHKDFEALEMTALMHKSTVIYDIKSVLDHYTARL